MTGNEAVVAMATNPLYRATPGVEHRYASSDPVSYELADSGGGHGTNASPSATATAVYTSPGQLAPGSDAERYSVFKDVSSSDDTQSTSYDLGGSGGSQGASSTPSPGQVATDIDAERYNVFKGVPFSGDTQPASYEVGSSGDSQGDSRSPSEAPQIAVYAMASQLTSSAEDAGAPDTYRVFLQQHNKSTVTVQHGRTEYSIPLAQSTTIVQQDGSKYEIPAAEVTSDV